MSSVGSYVCTLDSQLVAMFGEVMEFIRGGGLAEGSLSLRAGLEAAQPGHHHSLHWQCRPLIPICPSEVGGSSMVHGHQQGFRLQHSLRTWAWPLVVTWVTEINLSTGHIRTTDSWPFVAPQTTVVIQLDPIHNVNCSSSWALDREFRPSGMLGEGWGLSLSGKLQAWPASGLVSPEPTFLKNYHSAECRGTPL